MKLICYITFFICCQTAVEASFFGNLLNLILTDVTNNDDTGSFTHRSNGSPVQQEKDDENCVNINPAEKDIYIQNEGFKFVTTSELQNVDWENLEPNKIFPDKEIANLLKQCCIAVNKNRGWCFLQKYNDSTTIGFTRSTDPKMLEIKKTMKEDFNQDFELGLGVLFHHVRFIALVGLEKYAEFFNFENNEFSFVTATEKNKDSIARFTINFIWSMIENDQMF